MNLTNEQQARVREWAVQGDSLGVIQKKLEEGYGVQLTYMETRMLVADLEISLRDKEKNAAKPDASDILSTGTPGGQADAKAKAVAGEVTVHLDNIAQPNTMVSGSVQFSDGEQAFWAIDAMGRLSLDPDTPGYRPKEQDLVTFQSELRQAVRRAGY